MYETIFSKTFLFPNSTSIYHIFNPFLSAINIRMKREGRKHDHLQGIKG